MISKKNTFFDYEHYDETLDSSDALDEYERRSAAYEIVPDEDEGSKDEDKEPTDDEPEDEPIPTPAITSQGLTASIKHRLSVIETLTLENIHDHSDYQAETGTNDLAEDEAVYISNSSSNSSFTYPMDYIKELMKQYRKGDFEEKNRITEEFLAMLLPLIKSTIRRMRGTGSEFFDYIQHCNMYISMRIDKYDPEKSSPFHYFKYIIIEAISNYYDDSRGISGYYSSIDRKVRKIMREYESRRLRITPSKIAQETGISVRQAEDSLARILGSKINYEEDMTVHDKDNFCEITPEDVIVRKESEELLYYAIECLPDKEQTAILMSYGLMDDHISYSNKAISEVLHVSESKVKELLSTAKRRLRNDYALDQLRGKSTRITKRKDGLHDCDPSLYSFDPSCDEYAFLDIDEMEEEPVDSKTPVVCGEKLITFSDYE